MLLKREVISVVGKKEQAASCQTDSNGFLPELKPNANNS